MESKTHLVHRAHFRQCEGNVHSIQSTHNVRICLKHYYIFVLWRLHSRMTAVKNEAEGGYILLVPQVEESINEGFVIFQLVVSRYNRQ